MIKGMDHMGFIVTDLEKAIAFYRDVVGLPEVRRLERDGGPIDNVLGYRNTHIKGAMLSLGEGHLLELIQYINPNPDGRPTEERAVIGGSHLGLRVEDIDAEFAKLVANGAKDLNPPVEVAPGRKVCYMQDPDGNWIELLEYD
jgi:catechol 2,3-dioxygenase-like lactoylglutathione lyase family enzyme